MEGNYFDQRFLEIVNFPLSDRNRARKGDSQGGEKGEACVTTKKHRPAAAKKVERTFP